MIHDESMSLKYEPASEPLSTWLWASTQARSFDARWTTSLFVKVTYPHEVDFKASSSSKLVTLHPDSVLNLVMGLHPGEEFRRSLLQSLSCLHLRACAVEGEAFSDMANSLGCRMQGVGCRV